MFSSWSAREISAAKVARKKMFYESVSSVPEYTVSVSLAWPKSGAKRRAMRSRATLVCDASLSRPPNISSYLSLLWRRIGKNAGRSR